MSDEVQIKPSVIVQSAVRLGNFTIPGVRHFDHLMIDIIHILDEREEWLTYQKEHLGYLDQYGNYYSEMEAVKIALNAGQIDTPNLRIKLSSQLWNQVSDRKVVCAALRYKDYIFTAPRHYHAIHLAWFKQLPVDGYWRRFPKNQIEEGFVDQDGVFMDRVEALMVARRSGQMNTRTKTQPLDRLCSEDLY